MKVETFCDASKHKATSCGFFRDRVAPNGLVITSSHDAAWRYLAGGMECARMDLFEYAERQTALRERPVTVQQAAREVFQLDDLTQRQRLHDVYSALQSGPKTTGQMIEIAGHRFSTIVDELRKSGHKIDTVFVKGGSAEYVWHGFNPTCKVERTMQEAYYASEHWRQTARARKEIDGWRCIQCHASEELETHHWIYNLFAEDVNRDLVTLCCPCHKTIHERVRISFPKVVSGEIAERLRS